MIWREVKFRRWIWLNCAGISSSKTRNIMLSLKTILSETHHGQENHLSFAGPLRLSLEGVKMETYLSVCNHSILFWSRQFLLVLESKRWQMTLLSWDTSIIFSWTSLLWASSLSEFIYGHGLCNNNYLTAADCSVPRAADLLQGWRFYFNPFYIKIHSCAWNYLKEIDWNG